MNLKSDSRVDSIMFDLGDTLFEPLDSSFTYRNLLNVFRGSLVNEGTIDLAKTYVEARRTVSSSAPSSTFYLHREFVKEVLAEVGRSLDCQITQEALDSFCDAQRDAVIENLLPRTDCFATLTELRNQKWKLAIVSNIDDEWLSPLRDKWKLDDFVDCVLSSEHAQSCKPDSAIFLEACTMLSTSPSNSIFVGDSELNDIEGANRIGMKSVLIRLPEQSGPTRADDEITRLSEIFSVLDAIESR